LQDVVKASRPVWARVTGTFAARGGLKSVIETQFP
jgi:7-cyano-7-deazaguanine reductase